MPTRRGKGEGSISQRHDHPTCPPLVDGHRPSHACQGRWVAYLDVGRAGSKRTRRALYGRTKRDVLRRLNAAKFEREETGTVASSTQTVKTWLTYWLDVICVERGLKVNTMKSHRSKVNTYLIPHLGHLRLDHLEPEHIRAMYADLRTSGIADATLRQTHAILRRALTVAVREGKLRRNAAALMDPPKVAENKRTGLRLADARRLFASDNLRAHLALLGLRQGEALALHWTDVDLDAGTLEISRTIVRKPGAGLVYGTPKAAASYRMVPIPPRTLALFKLAALDAPDDGLVFRSASGAPVDPRKDWQAWVDLLDALGIPRTPLHAARNTAASFLEELGYADRLVAEILGQSQVTTTHRYQTASPEVHRGAINDLERHLALSE